MRVLVTGAAGYIGGRLVPELLNGGHEVVAAFTDPGRASRYWWAGRTEVVPLDVLDRGSVTRAARGVDAVVYLVHSMAGGDFARDDRVAATNLARVAEAAGVERIVYLGGIVPRVAAEELSEHIRSRLEVEEILRASETSAVCLRAAVVLGAGSTSFAIVRQVAERLLVQPVPAGLDSWVQPIAVTDVLASIVGALTVADAGRHFDVAGPERCRYSELLTRYAHAAGLIRTQVPSLPLPQTLVGLLAALLTDVPAPTVRALVESLQHDMVAADDDFRAALLPAAHRLVGIDEAIRRALDRTGGAFDGPSRDPLRPMPHDPPWARGQGGGLASAFAGAASVGSGVARALSPMAVTRTVAGLALDRLRR